MRLPLRILLRTPHHHLRAIHSDGVTNNPPPNRRPVRLANPTPPGAGDKIKLPDQPPTTNPAPSTAPTSRAPKGLDTHAPGKAAERHSRGAGRGVRARAIQPAPGRACAGSPHLPAAGARRCRRECRRGALITPSCGLRAVVPALRSCETRCLLSLSSFKSLQSRSTEEARLGRGSIRLAWLFVRRLTTVRRLRIGQDARGRATTIDGNG